MTGTINQLSEAAPPIIQLDNYLGTPLSEKSKTIFSIRIPAAHQAKDLSIVRMQNCHLAHILGDAKKAYRDMTKITVPTSLGPKVVKLHFFIFPNVDNEIQIDYIYSLQSTENASGFFPLGKEADLEVRQHLHSCAALQHGINTFASIVHDLVCGFADSIYFNSIADGKSPDYLIMTPPQDTISPSPKSEKALP